MASPKFRTNFIFPKNGILGASPFDATKFVKRGEEDYFVLTPTQAAALLIQWKLKTDLLENLKRLISYHPINLDKLKDHSNSDKALESTFNSLYNELKDTIRNHKS